MTNSQTDNKEEVLLDIDGMHCQSCANTITSALKEQGLEKVKVDYLAKEASFAACDKEKVKVAIRSIEKAGYKAHIHDESQTGEVAAEPSFWRKNGLQIRFIASAILTAPLLLHMFLHIQALHDPLVQLLICLPVFITGLLYFGKSAWGSLMAKSPNMDVLITMGFTAAFLYSLLAMRHYPAASALPLYFDTCATIITLVLLGNMIESRSVRQTTSALTSLLKVQKQKATKIVTHQGAEEFVVTDYKELQIGDMLLVKQGESIPVDGVITAGTASINESMVSGESMPVVKQPGDPVIGGTILVNGHLRFRAEKVGKDTVVAHIIDMVKHAESSAPKIQRIGDKVSAVFVPAVIAVSALTFLVMYFVLHINPESCILNSIAVLVVACPCAMGLATPTAVAVSLGMAARKGILIKGASTMEAVVAIKNVAFDKTGTLTTGAFSVKDISIYNGAGRQQVENILYTIEQYSTHPIAHSISGYLKGRASKIALKDIHEEEGKGMYASDEAGHSYRLGSYKIAEGLTTENKHSVYLLKDGKLVATIDLEDTICKNAGSAVAELKALGLHTVMLTGDKKAPAEQIAGALGIDEVHAEQLPYQKLDQISRLAKLSPTAMVGDGINDAPALAMANLGISLGGSTKIAMQAARVILLGEHDLSQLPMVFKISAATLKIIKQNLFWAILYNAVAIPLAASGIISPIWSAMVMSFSDVIVVGNSLRLKRIL